ncbi:MAG: radical SAM protein [Candidatus Omnitrophica bacterium]|nr:radical SAM protein [Candidatus Omnitrophota bacterium]
MDYSQFQHPQRYVGNEWNAIRKSHTGKIPICIGYPHLYEIGMSNVGLRIIYGMLNQYRDIVCERVFLPGHDYAHYLKTQRKKLCSLETKLPLDQFQVIGLNLNSELNYPNVLELLSLGNIPLFSRERKDIIVTGGGIANPEPLAGFIDVFFMGEFEAGAEDFLRTLRASPRKQDRLRALAELPGFYIPQHYSSVFTGTGYRTEKKYPFARLPVGKRIVTDLNSSYYPRKWLVPHTSIVHDRAQIEISRGCPNHCTFCQARTVYSPYRERSAEKVLSLLEEIYRHSGYENFSFLSLSASDHSSIEELIDRAHSFCRTRRIGLALPSLRIGDVIGRLYKKLSALKKVSLTVAVEAASAQLRQRMNKHIEIESLFEAVDALKSLKIRHVKAYFMLGIPGETDDDIRSIGRLIHELKRRAGLQVNASVNIFIPKPFTGWEALPMPEERILQEKREILFQSSRGKKTKLSVSPLKRSLREAILSRGDRTLDAVIHRVWRTGGIEGYPGGNAWDHWESALREEKIDTHRILHRSLDAYPWSFLTPEAPRNQDRCHE